MAKKKTKKMNPVVSIILLVILVILLVLIIVFHKEIYNFFFPEEPISEVTNINLDGTKLTWASEETDASFDIYLDGEKIVNTTEKEIDLSPYKDLSQVKEIKIITVKGDKESEKGTTFIIDEKDDQSGGNIGEYNYSGYYEGINYEDENKVITEKLMSIIKVVKAGNGSENSSYGEVRYILEESDIDPEDPQTLRGIYDLKKITPKWDGGTTWAREHVWPNSRLGRDRVSNTDRDQASDPHNLRAIDPSTNSTRSNRYFVNGTGLGHTVGANAWYPGDKDKGDVARILLYMAIRYPDILKLVETPNDISYELAGAQMGTASLLLTWHLEDPVDAFEINRNEVIFQKQGNRNPFIDHPELFEKVFNYILLTPEKLLLPENLSVTLQQIISFNNLINKAIIFQKQFIF